MNESDIYLPNISDGEDKSSPFKNRIRKNYRHIRKWARRTETNCFRIYDRDIKEYPYAIDFYNGKYSIQYFCSKGEEEPPIERKEMVEEAITSIFTAQPEAIYWRARKRRKMTEQYEKIDQKKEFFTVQEYGVTFLVNLVDYLDTGLFLDHRETRQLVAKLSKGKRLLNLFAYTASFSVHAAQQGASYTKSVDMSNTYTEWAKQNFLLNNLSITQNEIIRADCLQYLDEAKKKKEKYDVIVIDPPTISRSKKMDQLFDIQNDYEQLITKALQLLNLEGVIIFSTNSRSFRFDASLFPSCTSKDITAKTIPLDFHNQKIHSCYFLALTVPK